jgi:hypothetical protein
MFTNRLVAMRQVSSKQTGRVFAASVYRSVRESIIGGFVERLYLSVALPRWQKKHFCGIS